VRTYPERPVVGVGAVVLHDQCVLLIKRSHEPLKGEWSLPGGTVELGERLEDAIAREVREETGLEVEVGPIIEVLDRLDHDLTGRVRHHFVLVDFVCRAVRGTLRTGSDADAVTWARIDRLSEYGVADLTVSVITKAAGRRFSEGDRPVPW
jgi:mutator protein MutT